MFESREPLTEFFHQLIPAARAAGYKCIVTLLAREADSEEIFRDVKRYWSSLHDVTGEHVLFVLGAHHAARQVSQHTGIPERREPVIHVNPHAAIAGSRTVYWPGSSYSWKRDLRIGHLTPSDDVARAHSMEIAGLRYMFGLRERSIPALLIFALPHDAQVRPSVVLPFSKLGDSTIYGYLKKLVGDLEDQFASIQEVRDEATELRQRLDKLPDHEARWLELHVNLSTVETIPNAKLAADQILTICGSSARQQTEKRKCFDLLRTVAGGIGSHAPLTMRLQRLIDHAFFYGSPEWLTKRERRDDLEARLKAVLERERVIWRQVITRMESCENEDPVHKDNQAPWDYFIAYSSQDYWYADRLFAELTKTGKVFLDRLCLRPGDVWPVRLREEQDRARCTVVLLTENTDNAWFAKSECIHAIELARHGGHRIVPILIGMGAALPYGLEQIHAIRHENYGDFASTVRQIADVGSSEVG